MSNATEVKIECLCYSWAKQADISSTIKDVYMDHLDKSKVGENLSEVSILASTKHLASCRCYRLLTSHCVSSTTSSIDDMIKYFMPINRACRAL